MVLLHGGKMDKISVIVPVYNVEKYLKGCVDTIVNQTYKNLEIILVDDGSTDRSGVICDEYKNKDIRISVIHKKNGGLSDARNVGIEYSTGNYIAFVDSDDYIELNMFETLMNGIKLNGSDIAVANCQNVYGYEANNFLKRKGTRKIKSDIVSKDKEFFCREALTGWQSVWGKVFSKEIFGSLRFPVGRVVEDGYVIYDLLMRANTVSYHSDTYYYYRRNVESSIMGKKFTSRDTDMIIVNTRTYVRIKRVFPSLTEACLHRAVNKGFGNMLKKTYKLDFIELFLFHKEKKKMRKAVKYMLSDVLKSKQLPAIKKACVICFYISPTLLLLINKTGIILEIW